MYIYVYIYMYIYIYIYICIYMIKKNIAVAATVLNRSKIDFLWIELTIYGHAGCLQLASCLLFPHRRKLYWSSKKWVGSDKIFFVFAVFLCSCSRLVSGGIVYILLSDVLHQCMYSRSPSGTTDTTTDQYTRPDPRQVDMTPAVYTSVAGHNSTYETIGEHSGEGPYAADPDTVGHYQEVDLYTRTEGVDTRPAEYATITGSTHDYETLSEPRASYMELL